MHKTAYNLKVRSAHHETAFRDVVARAEEATAISREAYEALPKSDHDMLEQLQVCFPARLHGGGEERDSILMLRIIRSRCS